MHSIDVITLSGWGELMSAFLPGSGWIAFWDVLFFVVMPLVGVLATIGWARHSFKVGVQGAWRTAGSVWCRCLVSSLIVLALCWLGERMVLESNFGGRVTFAEKYKASLGGTSADRDSTLVIANRIRNADVVVTETDSDSAEYKIVAFFCDNYSSIHPLFYVLLDIIVLLWLFAPGFSMRRESITF